MRPYILPARSIYISSRRAPTLPDNHGLRLRWKSTRRMSRPTGMRCIRRAGVERLRRGPASAGDPAENLVYAVLDSRVDAKRLAEEAVAVSAAAVPAADDGLPLPYAEAADGQGGRSD